MGNSLRATSPSWAEGLGAQVLGNPAKPRSLPAAMGCWQLICAGMGPALCCCREQRISCPGKESTSTGLLHSQQLHVVFYAPNCMKNLETCYANETLFSCDFAAFLILLFHSGAVRSHLHSNN